MTKVLVTGMSGTGKSTALRELAARGHRTVDTDSSRWSHWADNDWIWREDAMSALLTSPGPLFVAGCKTNQGRFYSRFDHIVLLSAPASVLLARVTARADNPYGKTPAERAEILANLATVEPLLRATCTLEINAIVPVADVVARLETLVS
ncbi:AAA family ATPase [Kutzneria sp. CA-103260]|uniref:AAA family ATPase n=1 Tax=Kutzneria sp. CA-103260 TaxID=2802641 RepID=UPI001BEF1E11|nr:AAA family ATPase [Kutzneria sp. CA-103260]QUQ66718.1 Shikimate kinase [Kutzneria sp. CA-103260]